MSAMPVEMPEQQTSEEQQSGTPFERMSDEAIKAVETLFASCMKEEAVARRGEVRIAWTQRSMEKGIQHLWYDTKSYCLKLPEASGAELPRFMDVYNIYKPHYRSFVSVLSQNPPGVNFPPDDLQRSVDVTAASYAEKMRHKVDRLVHMKDRQMEAAGLFCTDGRTITRTRVNAAGKLEVTVHGVLESKVPVYARSMKRWGFAVLSEEQDIWLAKDEYSDSADKIESADSNAEGTFERLARLGVISGRRGYGDALKNLVTRSEFWLRPSRYRKAPEEVREELRTLFPNGLRATLFSGVVVDAVPQAMEEELAVEWPSPGQGQSRPSLLHDVPPIQQAYNDIKNMQRENAEYGIPSTWVDGEAVDSEALAEQRSEPGVVHVMNPPPTKTVEQCVFQEQPTQLSEQTVRMLDALLQDAQFTTGDVPSLYGGDTPGQDTVGVNRLLNAQAKGQLSPAWGALQWLWAKTYKLAVIKAATLMAGQTVSFDGAAGQEQFDPALILEGNFGCYPDTDSSFPETTADKRAALQMVLGQLAQAGDQGTAIVMQPDNLKLIQQYGGLSDLVIPGAEARDKQLREIEQLLREEPVPPAAEDIAQWQQAAMQARQQGQPVPAAPQPQPSVQVDEEWDYHQPEVDKIQEWLSSDARVEEERKGNFAGIANVKLHGAAHKAALAKQAAQQSAANQQARMSISGAFKDLDAATKVQVLQADGYKPDAASYETNQLQAQQSVAADTQKTAADAQHKAVLAAKEAVAPKVMPFRSTPPDAGKEMQ